MGLDPAIDGPGETIVELRHADDEPRIKRPAEHAWRRCRDGAVHVIDQAVAEDDPVVIEVVGDGKIEG
jgi:hypothetical protein